MLLTEFQTGPKDHRQRPEQQPPSTAAAAGREGASAREVAGAAAGSWRALDVALVVTQGCGDAATVQRAWARAADRRIFTFYASTVRAAAALPDGFLSSAAGGRGARALGSVLLPSGVAGLAAGVPATLELRLGVGAAPWPPEIMFRFRAARPIKVVQVGVPPGRAAPGGSGGGWRPLPRRGSETRGCGPRDGGSETRR